MRKKLSLLLVALMTVVTGAWAQATYTIYSNTSDNVTFKVGNADYEGWSMSGVAEGTTVTLTPKVGYGFYSFDAKPKEATVSTGGWSTSTDAPLYCGQINSYQKNEFIIPAAKLVSLTDKKIVRMHFGLSSYNSSLITTTKVKVFLKEVEETVLSVFLGEANATVVYEGYLKVENMNISISLNAPFEYKGGNLLVGMYITQPTTYTWGAPEFKGTNDAGSGLYGYSSEGLDKIEDANSHNFLPNVGFFTTETTPEVAIGEDGTRSFAMPCADIQVDYMVGRDLSYKVSANLEQNVFYTSGSAQAYVSLNATINDNFDEGNPQQIWLDSRVEDTDGNVMNSEWGSYYLPAGKYFAVYYGNGYAGEIKLPFEVVENYVVDLYNGWNDYVTFKAGDVEVNNENPWPIIKKGDVISATPKEGYAFTEFSVKKNAYLNCATNNYDWDNNVKPIDVYNMNAYQKNEMLYPAAYLESVMDKKIGIINFQGSVYGNYQNVECKVFMKEIEATAITGFTEFAAADQVYEGPLASNDGLEIALTTPYEYKGGNLLVGIYITKPAENVSGNFYRYREVEGSHISGYSQEGLAAVEGTVDNYLPSMRIYTADNLAELVKGDDGSRSFSMPAANQQIKCQVGRDLSYKVSAELKKNEFLSNGEAAPYVNLDATIMDNLEEGNPQQIWLQCRVEDTEGKVVLNNNWGNLPAGKYFAVYYGNGYAGEIKLPFEIIENYLVNNNWNENVIFKAGVVEANAENGWPIIKKGDKISATPKEGYIFTQFDVKKNNADASVYTDWNPGYGPFDTNNLNAYQKNEMLYPAANLVNLIDKKISTINFQGYAYGDNLECKVFMKEVEAATITDFTDFAATDMVYEGLVNFNNGFTVALSTPYEYKGGNLLLGIYITKPSENAYAHFYYANYIEGAHISGYSTESFDAVEATAVNYVPGIIFYTTENVAEVTEGEDGSRSFSMPAANQQIKYQVKRDLTVKVNAELAEGATMYLDNAVPRYFPGVSVFDVLDPENIISLSSWSDYTLTYEDAEGNELNANETHGAGKYVAVIKGINNYEGEIRLDFEFINSYWASNGNIAAGEYGTYFQNVNLALSPEAIEAGIELYAITEIGATTVTVKKVDVIKAETPTLVFNGGENAFRPLLIETAEEPTAVEPAAEFKGTLTGENFTLDEINEFNFYIFNGVDFVKVNTAGSIAANRCWLQIAKNVAAAPRLTIGFGSEATGINVINNKANDGQLYDLNGRRVSGSQKGIFILNGKKVVIK